MTQLYRTHFSHPRHEPFQLIDAHVIQVSFSDWDGSRSVSAWSRRGVQVRVLRYGLLGLLELLRLLWSLLLLILGIPEVREEAFVDGICVRRVQALFGEGEVQLFPDVVDRPTWGFSIGTSRWESRN